MADYADNWAQRTRWLRVRNDSAEQIPAFAAMRVEGHDNIPGEVSTAAGVIRQREQIWLVGKPNGYSEETQDPNIHLINGPQPIPVGAYGRASIDWPAQVLYTPDPSGVVESTIGFAPSSWQLAFGNVAYSVLGRDVTGPASGDGQRIWVVPAIQQLVGGASHVNVTGANQTASVGTTPVKITWAGQPLYNRGGHTLQAQSVTVGRAGVYEVHFHCSAKSDVEGDQINYGLYNNGQATHIATFRVQDDIIFLGGTVTTARVEGQENLHMSGILELAEGDVLDVRVSIDAGTSNVTTSVPALWLNRLGGPIA